MRKFIVAAFTALLSVSAFAQTPDALWKALMDGNKLYVTGQVVYGNLPSLRTMWAGGQNPPVSIVSCADSRVPAEIAFGRTVGELFVVRVAGNVEDTYNIASLEYAVKNQWTKLIVVMGHSSCGAVEAAMKNQRPTPAISVLVDRIQKSFLTPPSSLEKATIANVCYTAWQLRRWSTTLRGVPMKLAYFDIETGAVREIAAERECGSYTEPFPVCPLTLPPQ